MEENSIVKLLEIAREGILMANLSCNSALIDSSTRFFLKRWKTFLKNLNFCALQCSKKVKLKDGFGYLLLSYFFSGCHDRRLTDKGKVKKLFSKRTFLTYMMLWLAFQSFLLYGKLKRWFIDILRYIMY